MTNLLNILPGFYTSPPGVERDILRKIPIFLVLGSFGILCPSLILRLLSFYRDFEVSIQSVKMLDILEIGILIVYWLTIFTVSIGAILVSIMKGPAYVADAYQMEDGGN